MSYSTVKMLSAQDDQLWERIQDHLSVVRSMIPESNTALCDLIDTAMSETRQCADVASSPDNAPSM